MTDIVLKHYSRLGREAFRSALSMAIPQLMIDAPSAAMELLEKRVVTARRIVEASTDKTRSGDQARLLELLTPA